MTNYNRQWLENMSHPRPNLTVETSYVDSCVVQI